MTDDNQIEDTTTDTPLDDTAGEQTEQVEQTEATESSTEFRKDIVPAKYRQMYKELGGNCGDFIASELSALVENGGLDSLNSVKTENNIPAGRWGSLNNGQQRMNLSNCLRAAFLRGETITIVGKQYNLHTLHEEYGAFDAENVDQADDFLRFLNMPTTDRNRAALVRIFVTLPAKATATAKRKEEAEAKKAEKAKAKEEAEKAKAEKAEKAAAEKAAAGDGEAAADAPAKKPRRKKADPAADAADA